MIYTFNISGQDNVQNLSVSLEDIAGNHIDSEVNNFLITTNSIALWFNNKPLFIGSVALVILIIAVVLFILIRKKNRRSRRGF